MSTDQMLPVGLDDFAKLRTQNFYYVDKSGLIKELLENWGEVNLFTRPRRFGKTLNMSMLKNFFEIGCDKTLFDGLSISQEQKLCNQYMGKFPVIFVTLKGVEGKTYEEACGKVKNVIKREAQRFQFLLDSEKLTPFDKEDLKQLLMKQLSKENLADALLTLSKLLQKHYDQKAIVLIDEYDVPLDKAFEAGYYDDMVSLIRDMLGQVLKSNESLFFAVLTGCLRVSKESVFTGLNNLSVMSITSSYFDEYFGFTSQEVQNLLCDYNQSVHFEEAKEWYNGYRFGNVDIYCPWDIINYCKKLRKDPGAAPEAFWLNTSSNNIVRRFIQKADRRTQLEIESLISGDFIAKKIRQELTYNDMYNTVDNLWSVLFTTGYLTQKENDGHVFKLVIPNKEILEIFITQILEWLNESLSQDKIMLSKFCSAFKEFDVCGIEKQFNEYLRKTISIRDTHVRIQRKENFYHGILLGLLHNESEWYTEISNAESGDGYSDIIVEIESEKIGFVIEVRYAENNKLESCCLDAVKQIIDRKYCNKLLEDGMNKIYAYGIACYKKCCKVSGQKIL